MGSEYNVVRSWNSIGCGMTEIEEQVLSWYRKPLLLGMEVLRGLNICSEVIGLVDTSALLP